MKVNDGVAVMMGVSIWPCKKWSKGGLNVILLTYKHKLGIITIWMTIKVLLNLSDYVPGTLLGNLYDLI